MATPGDGQVATPLAGVSVIVTSYESPLVLRDCLASLSAQPEAAEIVVADCSRRNPGLDLAGAFPRVRFLHWPAPRAVPGMRWDALAHTSEAIVAAIEARCVPAPDWCARLLDAHRLEPQAPAVGGPVGFEDWRRVRESALYFAEYGMYCPPVRPGPSRDLSGANLSYKRAALEECHDLLRLGAWETRLHERWRAHGRELILCAAEVTFRNTMTLTSILRQRFNYGRGYAAARTRGKTRWRRALYALCTPVLPMLFAWRTGKANRRSGLLGKFARALPWFFLFQAAWSAGEACGYLFGAPRREEIY